MIRNIDDLMLPVLLHGWMLVNAKSEAGENDCRHGDSDSLRFLKFR